MMKNPASGIAPFSQRFDAVVMLTVSNWATEPRSNRYHYATRFAKLSRVIFVQPDRDEPGYAFSESGVENINILHVSHRFDCEQANSILRALQQKNIHRPLLWVYGSYYADTVSLLPPHYCIYHATEDYFCDRLQLQMPTQFFHKLRSLLRHTDLLIPVSEGVKQSFIELGGYKGRSLVLENGCDYAFWHTKRTDKNGQSFARKKCTAFYQGGINVRLDFDMIHDVMLKLPDWEFRFCGEKHLDPKQWEKISRLPNMHYLGILTPEEIAVEAWQATVGIIPFIQEAYIKEKSLPLKAFEYVACGLPVVTVPIRALERWPDLFSFTPTAEQFARAIADSADLVENEVLAKKRAQAAMEQSYDNNFRKLSEHLADPKQTYARALTRVRFFSTLYVMQSLQGMHTMQSLQDNLQESLQDLRTHIRFTIWRMRILYLRGLNKILRGLYKIYRSLPAGVRAPLFRTIKRYKPAIIFWITKA